MHQHLSSAVYFLTGEYDTLVPLFFACRNLILLAYLTPWVRVLETEMEKATETGMEMTFDRYINVYIL